GRGYLLEGPLEQSEVEVLASELFADLVVEDVIVAPVGDACLSRPRGSLSSIVHVLPKPGVMDPVAQSAIGAIRDFGIEVHAVRTLVKYWLPELPDDTLARLTSKVLANDAIEQVVVGPLELERLEIGAPYEFQLITVPLRELD